MMMIMRSNNRAVLDLIKLEPPSSLCTQVLPTVHLEEAHEVRKRSAEQELRIKLYYDESVYRLTKQQYNLIHETVLPSAVTYWGQALRVRKTENRIRLNR